MEATDRALQQYKYLEEEFLIAAEMAIEAGEAEYECHFRIKPGVQTRSMTRRRSHEIRRLRQWTYWTEREHRKTERSFLAIDYDGVPPAQAHAISLKVLEVIEWYEGEESFRFSSLDESSEEFSSVSSD